MKVLSAEYIKSINTLDQLPRDPLPQIAFAGRSNVGKSSLMNLLLNRKKLVKVSSTPGKTRSINFFLINQKFYFVDLPGYGYAKVSRTLQQDWQALMEQYLLQCQALRAVVLLFDLRHKITLMDCEFLRWLDYHNMAYVLVGTKADKLSGNELSKQVAENRRFLVNELGKEEELVVFSAMTGKGKDELWIRIRKILDEKKQFGRN